MYDINGLPSACLTRKRLYTVVIDDWMEARIALLNYWTILGEMLRADDAESQFDTPAVQLFCYLHGDPPFRTPPEVERAVTLLPEAYEPFRNGEKEWTRYESIPRST